MLFPNSPSKFGTMFYWELELIWILAFVIAIGGEFSFESSISSSNFSSTSLASDLRFLVGDWLFYSVESLLVFNFLGWSIARKSLLVSFFFNFCVTITGLLFTVDKCPSGDSFISYSIMLKSSKSKSKLSLYIGLLTSCFYGVNSLLILFPCKIWIYAF